MKVWLIDFGALAYDMSLSADRDDDELKCTASCVLASEAYRGVAQTSGAHALVYAAGETKSENVGVVACWEVVLAERGTQVEDPATGRKEKKVALPLFRYEGPGAAIKFLALLPAERLAAASLDGTVRILDLKCAVKGDRTRDAVLNTVNYSSVTALHILRCRFPESSKIIVGCETGHISVWGDANLLFEDWNPNAAGSPSSLGGPTKSNSTLSLLTGAPETSSRRSRGWGVSKMKDRIFGNKRGVARKVGNDNPVRQPDNFANNSNRASKMAEQMAARKNKPLCEYWAHGKRALQGSGVSTLAVLSKSNNPQSSFGVSSMREGDHMLFSASGDTTVKMWRLGKQECLHTFRGHQAAVTKITVMDGERIRLFSASNDAMVISWLINVQDPDKCHRLRTFSGHDHIITDMLLVRVPEFVRKEEVLMEAELTMRSDGVKDVGPSKEPLVQRAKDMGSHTLLTASRDGTVKQWSLRYEFGQEDKDTSDPKPQNVYLGTDGMTKLVLHEAKHLGLEGARDVDDGLGAEDVDDMNVCAACNDGAIAYIDLFPKARTRLTFRSANAYELLAPLIDWGTITWQRIGFVIPTFVTCLAITKRISQEKLDHLVNKNEENYQMFVFTKSTRHEFGIRRWLNAENAWMMEMTFMVTVAFFLLIIWSCGIYIRLINKLNKTKMSEEYVEECNTVSNLRSRAVQPAHKRLSRLRLLKSLVWIFLWGTTKILTVPILIHIYSLIDCPFYEDGLRHFDLMPKVLCFRGRHLYATGFCFTIVILYVLLVMPFTFVGCDADVFWSTRRFNDLFREAAMSAIKVDIAFLTPNGIFWCYNQFAEFMVKVTLPAIIVLQSQNHMKRSIMITGVLCLESVVCFLKPPYRHKKCCLFVGALKFCTTYIAACTIYGGYCADRHQAAPHLYLAVIAGLVCVAVATAMRWCYRQVADEDGHVMNYLRRKVERMHLNPIQGAPSAKDFSNVV